MTTAKPTDKTSASSHTQILHLEDSHLDHQLAKRALAASSEGFTIDRVETLEALQLALQSRRYAMVLADYRLNGFSALDAWRLCSHLQFNIPFVLLSGTIGEAAAVEAIQVGFSDYLHKDDIRALPRVIRRALDLSAARVAKLKADSDLQASQARISALAGHLQTAIEEERAAIAREIHDDIGGALTSVRLDLAWIQRHSTTPEGVQHVTSAIAMLDHAALASQRVMRNLRPAILDQGILPALQWLIQGFEARMSSKVTLRTSASEIAASPDAMLVVYRTVQESLTNICKYAPDSDVVVDVSHLGGALTVEVTDRGPGLPPDAMTKPTSYGLRGLSERAKTVGGWLDVSSTAGDGTSVTLSIPYDTSLTIQGHAP
jgi:two-component system, NarL family, sensor histidine kinase UhpB